MLTLEIIEKEIAEVIAHGDNRADIACLADLYVCRDYMREKGSVSTEIVRTDSRSEFAECVNGRCFSDILPLLEELLETIRALQPRLYDGFMSRLR